MSTATAVYYAHNQAQVQIEDHRHQLPSLSQIMPITNGNDTILSPDVFSQNGGSQVSTANSTPASSFSGQSGNFYSVDKCTCKSNANRIPRPRNAFILFRQKYHQSVLDEGSVIRTNPEVSRELGRRWRALSNEEREHWNQLAEEEKTNHAKKYPGYRYTPRRNGKNKNCNYCKQKQLRQQQIQLHNQQLLQLQQEQYQQYYLQQQQHQHQQQQQQASGSASVCATQPSSQQQPQQQIPPQSNMSYYIPSNPFPQQNYQFQYNNGTEINAAPGHEKLSPLTSMPVEHGHQYHPVQLNAQYAIGYEQQRFGSLPTPVNSMNYGFDNFQTTQN